MSILRTQPEDNGALRVYDSRSPDNPIVFQDGEVDADLLDHYIYRVLTYIKLRRMGRNQVLALHRNRSGENRWRRIH